MVREFLILLIVTISFTYNQGELYIVSTDYNTRLPINNLEYRAREKYEEMRYEVEKTSNDAVYKLNEHLKETSRLADRIIVDGQRKIDNIADNYKRQIYTRKYRYQGGCAEQAIANINQARDKINEELTSCANDYLNYAIEDVRETVSKILSLNDVMVQLGSEIDECNHESSCSSRFIEKTVRIGIQLIRQVTDELLASTRYLTNLDYYIGRCEATNTLAMTSAAQRELDTCLR